MSFRKMVDGTAAILGKKRYLFTVPFFYEKLYRAWIRLLSRDIHPQLIRVAIEVLRYDMVVKDNTLQRMVAREAISSREVLEPYLETKKEVLLNNPRSTR